MDSSLSREEERGLVREMERIDDFLEEKIRISRLNEVTQRKLLRSD